MNVKPCKLTKTEITCTSESKKSSKSMGAEISYTNTGEREHSVTPTWRVKRSKLCNDPVQRRIITFRVASYDATRQYRRSKKKTRKKRSKRAIFKQ